MFLQDVKYQLTNVRSSAFMFFKDQRDTEFVEELMNVLGDEVKEVESFVIVYKYKDRFTSPFARTLRCVNNQTRRP